MINIQMIGIDHSRASVEERELFSFTKTKQKELMEAVVRQQAWTAACCCLPVTGWSCMCLWMRRRSRIFTGLFATVNRFPEKKKNGYGNFLRCELKKTRCGIFFADRGTEIENHRGRSDSDAGRRCAGICPKW